MELRFKTRNVKSDVLAKEAYKTLLEKDGYANVRIVKSPADIVAEKDNQTWYFEIKMTRKQDVYFGAATLTEWEQAFKTPNNFFFVVAIYRGEKLFDFVRYTPKQFLEFSTVPPFKIFFNINFNGKEKSKQNRKKRAIQLTEKRFIKLNDVYQSLCKEVTKKD